MGSPINSNLFTSPSIGLFVFDSTMGIKAVSMELLSGSGAFTGALTLGSTQSSAIALIINEPVTITNLGNTINYLSIDGSNGVIKVIATQ